MVPVHYTFGASRWDEFAAEWVGSSSRIFEFDFHLTFRRDLFFFFCSSFVVCFVVLYKWILLFSGCVCLRAPSGNLASAGYNTKKKKKKMIPFRQFVWLAHHRICNLHLIWIWIGSLVFLFFFFFYFSISFSSVFVHFISFQRNSNCALSAHWPNPRAERVELLLNLAFVRFTAAMRFREMLLQWYKTRCERRNLHRHQIKCTHKSLDVFAVHSLHNECHSRRKSLARSHSFCPEPFGRKINR